MQQGPRWRVFSPSFQAVQRPQFNDDRSNRGGDSRIYHKDLSLQRTASESDETTRDILSPLNGALLPFSFASTVKERACSKSSARSRLEYTFLQEAALLVQFSQRNPSAASSQQRNGNEQMDRSIGASGTATGSVASGTSSSAYAHLLETLGQQTEDLNQAVATCAALKAENDALRGNYEALRDELIALKGQYDEARRQAITEAEARVATERRHEQLVRQWQEQLQARERELEEISAQISPPRDLEQLRSQIATELEEAHLNRLNALESDLSATRSAFMALQREHEGLRVQFSATIEERAKDQDAALDLQRTAMLDLQRSITRLQAEVDDGTIEAERRVRAARGAQSEAQQRLRLLEAELEDCRAQRDELKQRVDENERRFTREAADLRAAVALAESQARGLERQLSASEASFSQLTNAHAQLSSRAATQSNDLARLQTSLATAERRYEEEMQGVVRRHAAALSEMEQKLADSQGIADRLSAENSVLSQARDSFSARVTALQNALHECENVCRALERRALQAEGQLENGRDALDVLRQREMEATGQQQHHQQLLTNSAANVHHRHQASPRGEGADTTMRGRGSHLAQSSGGYRYQYQTSGGLAVASSYASQGGSGRRALSAGAPPPVAAQPTAYAYAPAPQPSAFSRTAGRPFSAAGDLQPSSSSASSMAAAGKSLAGLDLSRAIEAAVSVPAGTHNSSSSSSSYYGDSRGTGAAGTAGGSYPQFQFERSARPEGEESGRQGHGQYYESEAGATFGSTGSNGSSGTTGERRLSGSAGPVNLGTFSTFPSSKGGGTDAGDTARQFTASPSSPSPSPPSPSLPSPAGNGRPHYHQQHQYQHYQRQQGGAEGQQGGFGKSEEEEEEDDSFIQQGGGPNTTAFSAAFEQPQQHQQQQQQARRLSDQAQGQGNGDTGNFRRTSGLLAPRFSGGSPRNALEEAISLAAQAQGRADALQHALDRCQQELYEWRSKWERVTASVAGSLERQEHMQAALAEANSRIGVMTLELESSRRDHEENQRSLQRDVAGMQAALQQAEDALRQATSAFEKRMQAERETSENTVRVVAEKKEKYKLALLATRKKASAYKANLEALYALYIRVKQAAIDNAKVQAIVASTRETEARVLGGVGASSGLLRGTLIGGGGGGVSAVGNNGGAGALRSRAAPPGPRPAVSSRAAAAPSRGDEEGQHYLSGDDEDGGFEPESDVDVEGGGGSGRGLKAH